MNLKRIKCLILIIIIFNINILICSESLFKYYYSYNSILTVDKVYFYYNYLEIDAIRHLFELNIHQNTRPLGREIIRLIDIYKGDLDFKKISINSNGKIFEYIFNENKDLKEFYEIDSSKGIINKHIFEYVYNLNKIKSLKCIKKYDLLNEKDIEILSINFEYNNSNFKKVIMEDKVNDLTSKFKYFYGDYDVKLDIKCYINTEQDFENIDKQFKKENFKYILNNKQVSQKYYVSSNIFCNKYELNSLYSYINKDSIVVAYKTTNGIEIDYILYNGNNLRKYYYLNFLKISKEKNVSIEDFKKEKFNKNLMYLIKYNENDLPIEFYYLSQNYDFENNDTKNILQKTTIKYER